MTRVLASFVYSACARSWRTASYCFLSASVSKIMASYSFCSATSSDGTLECVGGRGNAVCGAG